VIHPRLGPARGSPVQSLGNVRVGVVPGDLGLAVVVDGDGVGRVLAAIVEAVVTAVRPARDVLPLSVLQGCEQNLSAGRAREDPFDGPKRQEIFLFTGRS